MNEGQIACCSYVSLGFGTPQMQYFLASMQDYYRPRKPILVCEPHSDAIPDRHRDLDYLSFHRVVSPNWKAPYWYLDRGAGESEYRDGVTRWLSVHRPEMLILTGVNQFEYLWESGHRPRSLIYYAFEAWEKHEMMPQSLRCHDALKDRISLALFPEANRLHFYNREFGAQRIPKVLVYNAPPESRNGLYPASKRNGRILMQGTIQWGLTYPEYLLNTQKPDIPIDLYGPIYGSEAKVLRLNEVTRTFRLRYFGFIPNSELARVRGEYSYVLVMWNPVNFNSLNACPNKLFEAIASGVPPICAPHPQCAEILTKYDCGILMRDWSFESFCSALEQARSLRGSARYRELVRNCVRAHRRELNWNAQFKKIVSHLPAVFRPVRFRGNGSRPARFILVNPDLSDEAGHAYRHGLNILSAAKKLGLEPVAIVNRILSLVLPDYVIVHPVFWHDSRGRNTTYPDSQGNYDAPAQFVRDLKSSLERERLCERDHVFLPSLSDDNLLCFAEWHSASRSEYPIRWHIVLQEGGVEGKEKQLQALRVLGSSSSEHQLRLYCETQPLAEDLQATTGMPVRLLPVPALATSRAKRTASNSGKPIDVACLSDITCENGFPLLPKLVEQTLQRIKRKEVRFAINCHPRTADLAALEELRHLQTLNASSGRVELYAEPLTNSLYSSLLRRSDIVLDVRDPGVYRRRISSVFVEALSKGKVVLVPRGSWMAGQLPPSSPWIYSRPQQVPEIVERIVRELPRHMDEAWCIGSEWRRRHTGENLVRTLLLG